MLTTSSPDSHTVSLSSKSANTHGKDSSSRSGFVADTSSPTMMASPVTMGLKRKFMAFARHAEDSLAGLNIKCSATQIDEDFSDESQVSSASKCSTMKSSTSASDQVSDIPKYSFTLQRLSQTINENSNVDSPCSKNASGQKSINRNQYVEIGHSAPLPAIVSTPRGNAGAQSLTQEELTWSIPRSLFEHGPASKVRRVSGQQAVSSVQKTMSGERLSLPHTTCKKAAIKRISESTLSDLIDGKFHQQVDRFVIVDCRFKYEYDGGHIKNAINFDREDAMLEYFLPSDGTLPPEASDSRTALIFHCEFSQCRAPTFVQHLRGKDRMINQLNYPHLHYPEIYVLDGGYCQFYTNFKSYCDPCGYVSMNCSNHTEQRKVEKFKRHGSYITRKLQSKSFVQQSSTSKVSSTQKDTGGVNSIRSLLLKNQSFCVSKPTRDDSDPFSSSGNQVDSQSNKDNSTEDVDFEFNFTSEPTQQSKSQKSAALKKTLFDDKDRVRSWNRRK
ncbi:hypothetical protein MP228_011304 [Amoeboaphelidium protococcarum]|nr:hypothetical protein MP228_011304 [Amoeboaphelidium protococcarum]